MVFLKAKWNNLILVNYKVSPELLLPYVPKGTQLDAFYGDYYISLVAFIFYNTRVLGLPIPFHINFEEVNLRFYVRPDYDKTKRGVVFLKELVPKKAISLIANTFFKEHYFESKMKHDFLENRYSYFWQSKLNWNKISVTINNDFKLPAGASLDEFITEHYWGYTKYGEITSEYKVWHPQWETCAVSSYEIEVDFAKEYGEEFSFLSKTKPENVCFTKGSEIKVFWGKKLK